MKVITVAEGYPPETGGGSIYAYELPRRLAKHGIKTLVVTGPSDEDYVDENNENVSVMRLNVPKYTKAGFSFSPNRFKFIFDAVRKCYSMRDECDIFHFHSGMSAKIVAWTLRNIFRVKKPFVMTFLGTFIGYYKKLHPVPVSNLFDFLSKTLIVGSKFDSFIVVDDGTHAYEMLQKERVKARIKKHYQCVDCDMFKPDNAEKGSGKVVGYIGRFDPMKGVDIFIKSLPAVFKQVPESRAVLVGDGPLMPDMKELADKLGISERVEFVGSVEHERTPYYMNLSDCLVFSDIRSFDNRDLMSLTHCESMACGSLIINSARPRKEWGVDTWICIDAPDQKEISSKIVDVLKHPEKYSHLAKNARDVALRYFSWDAVVNIYKEELEHLDKSGRK